MSTLSILRLAISDLAPDPANARTHGEENLDAITASLRRFGQVEPLVVQKGTRRVIAGHGRLTAMKKLGWTEVDVVELEVDSMDATALGIALNRTAELAGWDEEVLAKLLKELDEAGALEGVGFDQDQLNEMLANIAAGAADDVDEDTPPEPLDTPVSKLGDLWILGNHRLLCGDSSKREDLVRLLGGQRIHLVNTDPPYNVKVEPRSNNAIAAGLSSFTSTHHQGLDLARDPGKATPTTRKLRAKDRPLKNDFMTDEDFERILDAWFGNLAYAMEPGASFYIWGGYANCANYPPALKKHGLYFSQAIIWNKLHPVLTRKDFMGAHEWCQPAGTMVDTPEGSVPIESLVDGDRVVAYSKHYNAIIGRRHGAKIARTSRPFSGELLGVVVGGKVTHCTPSHFWSARLTEDASRLWCTYLMRKGRWWRVGKSMMLNSWGFGLKHRLYTEGGDEAWILSTHGSSMDAALEEQFILAKFGIPTCTWAPEHHQKGVRQIDDVARIYDRLDLDVMEANAFELLRLNGRYAECPLVTSTRDHVKVSRRVPFKIRACNLIAGAMAVPVPSRGGKVDWVPIDEVDRTGFSGDVYSMDVAEHHHYIADGIVTANCFYGWLEGAGHHFYGPNNVTDLWEVKKVNPQSMVHLTEKPVELAARAIEYSSKPGQNVLDLFGGSGSTIMACEHTNRRGFSIELDEAYADVIVMRWMKATGKMATLENGRTWDEVAGDRAGAAVGDPEDASEE